MKLWRETRGSRRVWVPLSVGCFVLAAAWAWLAATTGSTGVRALHWIFAVGFVVSGLGCVVRTREKFETALTRRIKSR
jgi:hypothetical protein